jgi:hypothetical protein
MKFATGISYTKSSQKFLIYFFVRVKRVSSVRIVTGYELEGKEIGVGFSARA